MVSMARFMARTRGDDGKSRVGGDTVSKGSAVIEILGTIDSVMSSLDMCKMHLADPEITKEFTGLQLQFGRLAAVVIGHTEDTGRIFTEADTRRLQDKITRVEHLVPDEFVSFQTPSGCWLNESRVRVRELERKLTPLLESGELDKAYYRFINVLSIYLFCMAVESSGEGELRRSVIGEEGTLKAAARKTSENAV